MEYCYFRSNWLDRRNFHKDILKILRTVNRKNVLDHEELFQIKILFIYMNRNRLQGNEAC